MSALVVAPEYGYVIATAIATGFHYNMQGMGVSMIRYKVMDREYITKNFAAEDDGA